MVSRMSLISFFPGGIVSHLDWGYVMSGIENDDVVRLTV